MAELLLDRGADPHAPDQEFRSPLHMAAQRGHVDFVRLLLDRGADASLKDVFFRTCLHEAVMRGHSEVTRAIVQVRSMWH